MTTVFNPVGATGIVAYADDSSDIRVSAPGATAIMVFNPDTANVVAVGVGMTEGDVDAIVPTSNFNGAGTVVGPNQTIVIQIPQAQYAAGDIYVSVAGDSATGNVFITPGIV